MRYRYALHAIASALLLTACAGRGSEENPGAPGAAEPGIGEMGGMCGGFAGFQCKAEGAYCKIEPGVCVKMADYAGVCAQKPQVCTMEYAPVCGCDGATYSNACSAASKGVSVAYKGECETGD